MNYQTARRITASAAVAVFLLSLLWQSQTLALDPQKALTQYTHEVWQTDHGLPQNSVLALTQTRDGYLWLGTLEGLVRFDGVRFTVFDNENTETIKNHQILALQEDRQGQLWIGTATGLVQYKDGQFRLYTTEDGLAHNRISALREDRQGNLWIGTDGGGLTRFRDGQFTVYSTAAGLSHHRVTAVYEDRQGQLWVGTQQGLNLFQDGRFTHYTVKDGLSQDVVTALHQDSAGALWIGTDGGGLNRFKDGRFTTYMTKEGFTGTRVHAIHEDREQNLWIGTLASGLYRFRDGQFASFTTKDGLTNNAVLALYEDREGSLWIGTYSGGLNRFKDGKFATFTTREGLSYDVVRSVFEDRAGNIWVGTSDGLNRYKDGQFTRYTTKDGLSYNRVLTVYEDRQGNIWVGTDGGGLNRFKDGKFTVYTTKHGLAHDRVAALYEDRAGTLWIGTHGGLTRLKDGKFTTFTTKDGLTSDLVWAMHEDRSGNLWLGTRGGGLNRYRDGRFSAFTTKEGLSNDIVLSLYEDQAGVLWIGTYGGGLNRLKDGKFTTYTTKEGLFDNVAHQIFEDQFGQLWLGCNKGIYRVSKEQLNDFAAGKIARITSVSYGNADGMRDRECNGGTQPSGWQSRTGQLWFPTIKGVVIVNPAKLATNQLSPPVILEQVVVDGAVVSLTENLQLAPGTQRLQFHYTALSFLAPGKVKFRLKLEGWDRDWVDADTRRVAYYNNLPPGSYRFRVMAANNDGVWNETGTSFSFYLAPHFYQTYWFYAGGVLAILLSGLGLFRWRVRRLKTRETELVRLVDERTQELQQEMAERQRAAEALRESEERYRVFVQQSSEAIWCFELEQPVQIDWPAEKQIEHFYQYGYLAECNDEMAKMYGFATAAEILGFRLGQILIQTDPQNIELLHALIQSEYRLLEVESHELNKQGQPKYFLNNLIGIIEDGQLMRVWGTQRDITERQQWHEALRKSEERFQLVARATNDAIWDWNLVTNELWWNDGVETLFGYPKAEIGPDITWWENKLHPEDKDRVNAKLQDLIDQGGCIWLDEYRYRRRDGSYAPVIDRGFIVQDNQGRPLRMIGSMMDITERKQAAEEMQKAKEAAEAANRAKSEFLANMSHEIRTPMNGIIGMTELALDTTLTVEQREYLEMVKSSADSLLTLLNDILDFSKIEAGKLSLDPINFDLRDSLDDTMKTLSLRAHQKGLELAYRVAPEVAATILGDPSRLRQIIVNLVGNAIKFTEKGEVVVSAAVESQTTDQLTLHFQVSDTGIGIPAEKQRLIFEAFSQADGSTTRRYGGTGLGLTISTQLVELMGGRIWLESEVGRGSTFHFTIQVGRAATTTPLIPSQQPLSVHNLAVLVVDDNATNRRILEEMLMSWHMRPRLVESGPAALAALEQAQAEGEPYPLVLLDAHMPEMDGFALADKIKHKAELTGATIMMLSSAGQPGDAARCRELGIAAYLTKPIKQSELLNAILLVLGASVVAAEETPLITRHTVRAQKTQHHILLAEDNIVNQRLTVRLLEKQGYSMTVVANGKEAVQAVAEHSFDIVLMDVQMPELNGLEATAAIRQQEASTGRHIPIIAMTAHAMKGDRERCLAAGMDGYVSKPIQAQELFEAINQVMTPPVTRTPSEPVPAASAQLINRADILARVDGDLEFLHEMIELFSEQCLQSLAELRAAQSANDRAMLERIAHTLKGAVGNFSAPAAYTAAERLELLGRSGNWEQVTAACTSLEEELLRLRPALAALTEEYIA